MQSHEAVREPWLKAGGLGQSGLAKGVEGRPTTLHLAHQVNRTAHAGINPELLYKRHWRSFARRRNAAIFLLYSWLPVTVAVFFMVRWSEFRFLWCVPVSAGWGAAALVVVWWAGEFRCPRCSRRYGLERGLMHIQLQLFGESCSHCKLAKFDRRNFKRIRAPVKVSNGRRS